MVVMLDQRRWLPGFDHPSSHTINHAEPAEEGSSFCFAASE
jgi:hypothetical protein